MGNRFARRIAVAGLCAGMFAAGHAGMVNRAEAQYSCDPNYGWTPGGCVPGNRDYDCWELHAMGIGDIPVIGYDWQRLDGNYDYYGGYWTALPDGLGCEWWGE